MQVTGKQGQWIGDITVRETGSFETIIEMGLVNNMSITDFLEAGTMVEITEPIDKRIMSYYDINAIYPATTIQERETLGGIGYMGIAIDFIVS